MKELFGMCSLEIEKRGEVARQAAEIAGQILRQKLGNVLIDHKQSYNLVTDADLQSEEAICNLIADHFPNDKILREEGASSGALDDEHLWIVDPLDGTNNFAHGIPQFSVSIAFASRGVVRLGIVFDPVSLEMFWAERNDDHPKPAMLNGQPIVVSANRTLKECIIGVGFYYDRGEMMRRTLTSIERLFEIPIQGIRRFGSAALDICWVAAGRFDGYFEYQLSPWDYAAAWIILEQAGGNMYGREGNPMNLDSQSVIATNRLIDQELIDVVRW